MSAGRWRVKTENSDWLIDLREGWVLRVADDDKPNELRMDGERIPLVRMDVCEVGKPMSMLLAIRDDGVTTWRYTSPVIDKRPV